MNRRQTKKAWSRVVVRWQRQHTEFRLLLWSERVRRNFVRSRFWPGLSRADMRVRQSPAIPVASIAEGG